MMPNDPLFINQWGLMQIRAPLAWDQTKGGKNVTLAIIDSGIMMDRNDNLIHEDLRSDKFKLGKNCRLEDKNINDKWDHGTGVAGVVAADTDNNLGIAGMNWYSDVIIYKIIEGEWERARSVLDAIVEALLDIYLKNAGHVVINMSIGVDDSYEGIDTLKLACRHNCLDKGMIICAPAGNKGSQNKLDCPARWSTEIPGIIAVGATNRLDEVCDYSNRNFRVTVVAPGADIWTTSKEMNGYRKGSGTSFATPFVTGLASLIWSKHPQLTNIQVIDTIKNTTFKDFRRRYPNIAYGYGRINAEAALMMGGWEVTLESPKELNFVDVKEGETRVLDVKFNVKSFHATAFEIVKGLSGGFEALQGTSVSLDKTTDYHTPREVVFPISYTGTTRDTSDPGSVTIRCVQTGEEWDIKLSGNTVASN